MPPSALRTSLRRGADQLVALMRLPVAGGLTHHSDAGSQGTSFALAEHLDDWAARRLAAAPDGTLASTSVSTDPPVLATVDSIALAKGHLDTVESFDPGIQEIYGRTVQWGGTPSHGPRTDIAPTATAIDCSTEATCTPPIATEDGHIAQVAPNAPGGGPEITLRNGAVTDVTMNLVLYRKRDGATLWTSNTSGHPGAYALLQDDGNFVVYRSGGSPTKGGALWSTGTYKNAQ